MGAAAPARRVARPAPGHPRAREIPPDASGSFRRRGPRFTDRIVADPTGEGQWPVEPGRYRLVVSLACPWAHRSIIVRRLMGLEDAISMAITDPIQDERSWRFTLDEDGVDPVLGYRFLEEAYLAHDPENGTENGVSVPALVEESSGLLAPCSPASTSWMRGWSTSATSSATTPPRPTSGCSRRWCASTRSTTATSSATGRSSPSPAPCGPTPADLYHTPGFGDTVDFDHITRHYFQVHTVINATQIVPLGPETSVWLEPHRREELGRQSPRVIVTG